MVAMIMLYLNPDVAVHGFVRGRNRETNGQTYNRQTEKRQRQAARNAAEEGHRRERESERERYSIHIAREGEGKKRRP